MKIGILFLTLLAPLLSGCFLDSESCRCPYADPGNWVIREEKKSSSDYDVFYIYPTLVGKADAPEMEWKNQPKVRRKISGFAEAQTHGIFGPQVRVFAPYIHQLTYTSVTAIMAKRPLTKNEWPAFERGMKETLAAFRHYLRHYNRGRPYILLGHSQGAMDLYYLLEHCPEITRENGFVAAYLAGLPHRTAAQMNRDFQGRIRLAQNADDPGVAAVWNSQNAEADAALMAGNGEYCINPLNWRTDDVPAPKEQHLQARFYDYRNGSVKKKSRLFSAQVDPKRGVLLIDLPSNSEWDANAFMGPGIFHMNDVWFFAGNLRANAENRVRHFLKWKKNRGKSHD